jgi:hypothetical protein
MRTILAILAALAIATAAHAETEALVTDANGNVISGRSGALEFTNDIRLVSVSGDGAQFIYTDDDGNIANAQSGPPDLFDNLKTSLALPSWATTANASNARTDIGLGTTNTVQFGSVTASNVTLSTLTNASGPNLVLADTNGTLTTGSVPSGAAPLGAVNTADGAGGSSFALLALAGLSNVRDLSPTNDFSVTNTTAPVDVPGVSWTVGTNETYLVVAMLNLTHGGGGFDARVTAPTMQYITALQGGMGLAINGGGGFTPIGLTSSNSIRLVSRGGTASTQQAFSQVFFTTGTNGGTATMQWSQNATNASATTLLSTSKVLVFGPL